MSGPEVISLDIGAYSALATKDALLGVAPAIPLLMIIVYYGFTLTEGQIGAIATLLPLLVGYQQRF